MGVNWTGLTGPLYSNVFERVPVIEDSHYNILGWGLDNLYPQWTEQVRLGSSITKSSSEVLADFLNGVGFESNGDKVINRFGETVDDILNLCALDASQFSGAFALHVNYNGLGDGVEVQRVPVPYVRFKISNRADGRVTNVAISNNWENSNTKPELKPKSYPLLNPLTAAEETIKGGRGQILFYTGQENGRYPLATFDSVLDSAITDANLQLFSKNAVARGFHGAVFFKYPAPINSEAEEEKIKTKVNQALGPDGVGAQVVSVDEDFTGDLIETVDGLNVDDIFATTLQSVEDRITNVFKQPPALMGSEPQGGVFTQISYIEAHNTYNSITKNGRIAMARAFNKVTNLMGFEVGQILPNTVDQ